MDVVVGKLLGAEYWLGTYPGRLVLRDSPRSTRDPLQTLHLGP